MVISRCPGEFHRMCRRRASSSRNLRLIPLYFLALLSKHLKGRPYIHLFGFSPFSPPQTPTAVAIRRASFNCRRIDALLAFAWKHAPIRWATCDGRYLYMFFFCGERMLVGVVIYRGWRPLLSISHYITNNAPFSSAVGIATRITFIDVV